MEKEKALDAVEKAIDISLKVGIKEGKKEAIQIIKDKIEEYDKKIKLFEDAITDKSLTRDFARKKMIENQKFIRMEFSDLLKELEN